MRVEGLGYVTAKGFLGPKIFRVEGLGLGFRVEGLGLHLFGMRFRV